MTRHSGVQEGLEPQVWKSPQRGDKVPQAKRVENRFAGEEKA
jgi:hypothetical protein